MRTRSLSYIAILLMVACKGTSLSAQQQPEKPEQRVSRVIIYASDTVPMMHIPELNIYDVSKYSYLLSSRKYKRTIYNVRKAYPFAVIANEKLRAMDEQLAGITSKKEQKEFISQAEAELMKEFEEQVKQLTISQGIILVKLIDRETGMTSYDVIRDIRGGMTAFFWQGIARLFGNNLKLQFDPVGEDQLIEDIIGAMAIGYI